jgi:hypothetical protein
MRKQWLLSAVSAGGLSLMISGAAFFQFYALSGFGDVDLIAAAGAGMMGAGGLVLLAAHTGSNAA